MKKIHILVLLNITILCFQNTYSANYFSWPTQQAMQRYWPAAGLLGSAGLGYYAWQKNLNPWLKYGSLDPLIAGAGLSAYWQRLEQERQEQERQEQEVKKRNAENQAQQLLQAYEEKKSIRQQEEKESRLREEEQKNEKLTRERQAREEKQRQKRSELDTVFGEANRKQLINDFQTIIHAPDAGSVSLKIKDAARLIWQTFTDDDFVVDPKSKSKSARLPQEKKAVLTPMLMVPIENFYNTFSNYNILERKNAQYFKQLKDNAQSIITELGISDKGKEKEEKIEAPKVSHVDLQEIKEKLKTARENYKAQQFSNYLPFNLALKYTTGNGNKTIEIIRNQKPFDYVGEGYFSNPQPDDLGKKLQELYDRNLNDTYRIAQIVLGQYPEERINFIKSEIDELILGLYRANTQTKIQEILHILTLLIYAMPSNKGSAKDNDLADYLTAQAFNLNGLPENDKIEAIGAISDRLHKQYDIS